jgi:hypothetical protein
VGWQHNPKPHACSDPAGRLNTPKTRAAQQTLRVAIGVTDVQIAEQYDTLNRHALLMIPDMRSATKRESAFYQGGKA